MSKDMLGVAVRTLVTLPTQALGVVCDLLQKMSDPDWEEATKHFLRKENPWGEKAVGSFPIWKTIRLGTGLKSADDFRNALKRAGMKIGNYADDILGKSAFTASETETEVDLVNISVADLGFKNSATLRDIYVRAQELGLQLCPAEVGPQLRLQYKDQPDDEWLRIAIEPITDSDGSLHLFRVARHSGGLWLGGGSGDPEDFWDGVNRFVFVGRK